MRLLVAAFLTACVLPILPSAVASGSYSDDSFAGPGVFGAGVWGNYRFHLDAGDTVVATVTWNEADGLLDGYFSRPSCSPLTACPAAYVDYFTSCPDDGFTILDHSPATFGITALTSGTHRLDIRAAASATAIPYHLDLEFSNAPTVVAARTVSSSTGEPQCLVLD